MAQTIYLELTLNGSAVEGESTVSTLDRAGSIECWSFDCTVEHPTGPGGTPTGAARLGTVTIVKPIDPSTPLLMQGLVESQRVDTARFRFFRPSSSGTNEHFFTVELAGGRITQVAQESKDETAGGTSAPPPLERVSFVAERMTWTFESGGITFEHTPSSP